MSFRGFMSTFAISLSLTLSVTSVSAANPRALFSTYFGGSGFDEAFKVVTDTTGNIYVAGLTTSPSLPGTTSSLGGPGDAFVAKFTPPRQLLYSRRIGGSSWDQAVALAIDASGNVYVVGSTGSADFPIASGFQTQFGGGFADAFVLKLGPGGELLYSTFVGGSGGNENVEGIV